MDKYHSILQAKDQLEALTNYFSFLADNTGFDKVLQAIMAQAHNVKVEENTLIIEFVGGNELRCSPPADLDEYAGWPKSFLNIIKHHEYLSFPEEGWSLNLGEVGGFESDYLEDGDSDFVEEFEDPDSVQNPITDYSDWWLYHPTETNASGEPALCYFSHESCEPDESVQCNVGSLFLQRVADIMELEVEIPQIKAVTEDADDLVDWYDNLVPEWKNALLRYLGENKLGIQALRELIRTSELSISDSEITSLEPLQQFKKLKTLNISNTQISSLIGIEHLAGLRELDLSNTSVTDFSVLENMPKLTKLVLSGTALNNMEQLPVLQQLKELDISGTKIKDLSDVEKFTKICSLVFGDTQVSSIESLRNLSDIGSLHFEDTPIRDLSPIYGKSSIYTLSCRGAKLSFSEILSFGGSLACSDEGLVGHNVYSEYNRNYASFVQAVKSLEDVDANQCEALGFWVNEKLKYKLKKKYSEQARELIEAFFNLPTVELSLSIRTKLAVNVVVALCFIKDKQLARKIFDCLRPEEIQDKEIAYNLACYYAKEGDKGKLMKSVTLALELGQEPTTFEADDFAKFKNNTDFKTLSGQTRFPSPHEDLQKWWHRMDEKVREYITWQVLARTSSGIKEAMSKLEEGVDLENDTGLKEAIINLEEIDLRDVESLEFIRYLTNLRSLHVSYSSYTSVEPLENLVKLEKLVLEATHYISNKKINSIDALKNLTKLKILDITGHEFQNISALAGLENLESLHLHSKPIASIDALVNLTKLKDLSLSGKDITDLTPIHNLKQLEDLDVSSKEIGDSDIEFIRDLKQLQQVWVGDNITSLTPFEDLPKLKYLCIRGSLDAEEVKAFQKKHPTVDFQNP